MQNRLLGPRLEGYAREWLAVAPTAILALYLVELLFNRILFRVIIFIPYGPVQDAIGDVITVVGVASLNFTVLASLATLALLSVFLDRFRYIPAIIALFAVFDYLGFAKLYWTLPLVSAYIIAVEPRRVAEALFLALLAVESMVIDPRVSIASNLAWLVLPVTVIALKGSVNRKWLLRAALPAIIALSVTAGNTYIAGQVFIFAMGLLNPWMLAPAILLYSAAGSTALLGTLLTGPSIQLSSQILALSSLYLLEIGLKVKDK